jgi:hypothetical protein
MRKSKVRIVNPLAGDGGFTSINRARRFVKHGQARFTSAEENEIEFMATPKQAAITRSAEERLHTKITGVNIDRLAGTFYEHARGLPMVRPQVAMRGKKREGSAG